MTTSVTLEENCSNQQDTLLGFYSQELCEVYFPIDKMYIKAYYNCMVTIRVSATAARNKFFSLLDQVAQGVEVIVEKDHKEVAVISPKKTKTDWKGLLKASKKVHGIWKDYDPKRDSPLRDKKIWKRLGTWDKDILDKYK